MALLIDNDVTARVLEMADAVDAVRDAFTQLGEGDATFQPRTDIWSPTADAPGDYYRWGSMLGATRDPPRLAFRFKSDVLRWEPDGTEKWFNGEPGTFMGFVLLFDTSTGELVALLNDGVLHHVRVGATAGVACDALARSDARSVGVIGSGGMARDYLRAFAVVRDIETARVYSPTRDHRRKYAEEMGDEVGVDVTPVDSARDAVEGAGIVATCTDSREPVYPGGWVEPGQFVINVRHEEITDAALERMDRVYKTWNEPYAEYRIREPDGDSRPLDDRYRKRYRSFDYPVLSEVLVGDAPGREAPDERLFYYNSSAAIQFASIATLVHEKAVERGLGTPIPLDWFQQGIRN